ncbi:high-affinity Zn(2+) transporter zrt1 [Phytophthora pseudosyringae]|uniref:High-affinity Zn(2+) transporter zrt1 n=1 Tax=Phytophthora pseudosyringae TaxID=221518 RepID=A0A8T1W4P7_9STRA|nr:high-affinity Zn(2+) transporter zrt1 [Phytophthora pseudosyringae]
MARASALDLFGLMQSGASRLQHTVNQHLNLLTATSSLATGATFQQVTVSPSCSFRSAFVQASTSEANSSLKTMDTASVASSEGHLQALSIDGVALLIVSFLDGGSLARVQGVNRAWRAFIQPYRECLYRTLVEERRVFHTVITSASAFKSYLFSMRHELDRELAHTHAVHPTHQALEQFCASTEQHGFVAMFCDIIEFRDPRIARFVAWKRQSALSMVLAATPEHVMNFRKRSSYVGPITFVPVDNPLWPVFTSAPVDAPGFLGYAFDHVTMVPGYEALKDTVVKSILKELMIFDTPENAAAYGRSIGRAPYAAILEDEDAQVQVGQAERTSHLTFSSSLRRQLSKYPVAERIHHLRAKIKAVDDCIAATPNSSVQ